MIYGDLPRHRIVGEHRAGLTASRCARVEAILGCGVRSQERVINANSGRSMDFRFLLLLIVGFFVYGIVRGHVRGQVDARDPATWVGGCLGMLLGTGVIVLAVALLVYWLTGWNRAVTAVVFGLVGVGVVEKAIRS